MFRKIMIAAIPAVAVAMVGAGPALASVVPNDGKLPAPGVFALVAIGVIGAIALARSRK